MSLRFILGRAGTGKSHYIMNNINHAITALPEGPPVILLVPEQATFQVEYGLAGAMGGSVRAQVLSFRRLAHRVLLETGGAARIPIGELGKRMVIRRLLERLRDDLRLFSKSSDTPGFADTLARTIGEFKTYLVTPDNLVNASRVIEGSELLREKLQDLSILYHEFGQFIASRFTDPDDYLTLLAQQIPSAQSLKGAEIWIDGFKGFTPQEIKVIQNLFAITERVNVALCLDPDMVVREPDKENPFYPVWETYRNLLEAASIQGVPTGVLNLPDSITAESTAPPRFKNSQGIAHLEKHFFSYPASVLEVEESGIKLVGGSNRRAEVEACAREIIRLVQKHSLRWRDIAILLRDMESYHELVSAVFNDYEIPFFIDRKRNVLHHPLVELIRSALEVVEKDWAYQPVFRYLKTDLVPVAREEVFQLENYVLAHGIRGSRWTDGQAWTFMRRYTLGEDQQIVAGEAEFLDQINQTKTVVSEAMIRFSQQMATAATVRQKTTALYHLLEELGAAETIEKWSKQAEEEGQLDKAREHAQIWSGVIDLIDEVVEAMGEDELDIHTYMGVLDAGFESMTVGLIPPGIDQIVVASLDRSRSPEVRAAFILGANEGVFPARVSADGIFSDSERQTLEDLGMGIAPGSRRRAFEEQFLVYTALTRASELLWVSYAMADDEGRAVSPSPIVNRLREIIPGIAEKSFQVEPVTAEDNEFDEFIVHQGRAQSYLLNRLRDTMAGTGMGQKWWELYNWFIEQQANEAADSPIAALFHTNNEMPIGREKTAGLYGTPVRASVSRVEKFKACPFAHFSSYGLKLEDRKVHKLEAPDMGEFFHAALKGFTDRLQENKLDWGALSREQLISLSEEVVEELAPKLQSEILLSTARYRYLTGKLRKTVNRAVLTLAEHARRSSFRPVAAELAFGKGAQVPPFRLTLPDGNLLELSGRIDRLDIAEKDDRVYLRVIDYKSGEQGIRLQDIYHGLKLQLLTYLNVALGYYSSLMGRDAKPAGIFYYMVREPMVNVPGPQSAEEAGRLLLNKLKMKGFILNDRDVFRMMDNQTESGWSELFPVGLKQDGSFYSTSPVLDEKQFQTLGAYLENVFMEVGEEILAGKVDILPFREKLASACQFCGFKAICKFDNMLKDNTYRTLPKLAADEIWDLLAQRGVNPDEQS